LAYEFQISDKWYTKPAVGLKKLHHYNDFVGAYLDVTSFEIHETISYQMIKKAKYILQPNIGLNYRFYKLKGKMEPPHNTLPQRAWVIELRDRYFILNNF
jgi:hypothetical protein